MFLDPNINFEIFRKHFRGSMKIYKGSDKYEEIYFTPKSFKTLNHC